MKIECQTRQPNGGKIVNQGKSVNKEIPQQTGEQQEKQQPYANNLIEVGLDRSHFLSGNPQSGIGFPINGEDIVFQISQFIYRQPRQEAWKKNTQDQCPVIRRNQHISYKHRKGKHHQPGYPFGFSDKPAVKQVIARQHEFHPVIYLIPTVIHLMV
jgi:hypothetical protein